MTKISKKAAYPIKKPIDKDYFVGSDSELFGKTVNFSFEETAYLINKLNGSLIVNYLFKTDNNINLEVLTEGVFLSEDNETEVSSIAKLYINKKNFAGDDLTDLYAFLKINKNSFFFKLQNSEDLKNACYFNITDVIDHTDYFIFSIDVFLQNQALQNLVHFNVYFFSFDIKSAAGSGNEDKFTSVGTISLVDNEITISTGFEWEINSGEFANVVPFIETIPFSSTGNQRFVLFVANAFDTFEMISGPESISNPVAPPVPENTIQLTLLLVTDGVIGNPTLPDLSDYATINYVDGRFEEFSNVDNTSDINKPVSTAQASADAATLASANSYTDAKTSGVYLYKGNKTNYADLVATGEHINGYVYNLLDTEKNYAWNGFDWDDIGGSFDVSGKLDKGTYTGNAGDLKTDIDNIYQPDTLISSVAPTRAGNTFTYPALGYTALILKTIRNNSTQLVTTIDVATTDYKRVDLIYFKSDNTIDKLIGTESLTVAERPNLPANAVAISFINVFGNVISDPTPITKEISIQDYSGTEKFKITDYLRFKGVSFDAAAKALITDALIPLSAFLDVVNGNDTTAVLENASKPFKTIQALLTVLPVTAGETYTIYITGGTVDFTRRVALRNLRFVAYKDTILDFTNVLENDGVTNATAVFTTVGSTEYLWEFENRNISIQSTYSGTKYFSTQTNNCYLSLLGTINNLNWRSTSGATFRGSVYLGISTDLYILNCYQSNQSTCVFQCQRVGTPIINIERYYYSHATGSVTLFGADTPAGINILIIINNVLQTGTTSGLVVNLGCFGAPASNKVWEVTIGNISPNVLTTFRCSSNKITFKNGSLNSFTNIDLTNALYLTGVVNSVNYIGNSYCGNNLVIENFTGKLNGIDIYATGTVTFSNCQIQTNTYLAGRGYNSTIENCVHFRGYTTINQITTSNDLFKTSGIGSATIKPILIDLVAVNTNATTYGVNTNYINTQTTFKEKLNEIVVRNKSDLINKTLNSTITYIIDGSLVLLTGEYIEVPAGGLTITGYGFNASSISKNVSGQSIFTSPISNSGDFVSKDISYYPGLGTVFNLTDATGSHAIELNDINFQGVTGSALGVFNGYRQFTGTTCGFYGLSDGLTLEGNWSGFKLTNSNIIGFGASGTLFKKGSATVFSNRFYIDLNIQVATGSKICDFDPANLTNDKSLQVVNCYVKVNGVINASLTSVLFPNIAETSSKAYFVNNIGVKNSNITPYGLSTANLLTYADDTAAAAGGVVQIGDTYIEATSGYFKKRLS